MSIPHNFFVDLCAELGISMVTGKIELHTSLCQVKVLDKMGKNFDYGSDQCL